MVICCVAYKCPSLADPRNPTPFHCFPFKRPEILKLWIHAIRRENWKPSRTSRLCGRHFLPSDYQIKPGCTRQYLKVDAVPSIFDFPKHLQKNITPRREIVKHNTIQIPTDIEIRDVGKDISEFSKKSSFEVVFMENDASSEAENRSKANESPAIGSSNTGVIKIYKANLKNVVAEKERTQIELRQKIEEVKKLQKENQALREEKEKWFLLYNTGKNNKGKSETQITNMSSKLQSKESEIVCLKKEVENLKKELKKNTLNYNNVELRLTRACEENEKLKVALKQSKEEEKEAKEGYKKQVSDLVATIKQIEKQKIELLTGFQKQMQLIDVLKKQKMHMETLKVSEMTQAEYLKILDWKFD